MTPTTRRHPRTLSDAFPQDRAYCMEVYTREHLGHKVARWLSVIIGVVLVSAVALGY